MIAFISTPLGWIFLCLMVFVFLVAIQLIVTGAHKAIDTYWRGRKLHP